MATLETITSASTPTLKPVKYVTEGYNSIKFVGVATYREFLEDVKETSRIVIEVSFICGRGGTAYAADLKSALFVSCGFESHRPHHLSLWRSW